MKRAMKMEKNHLKVIIFVQPFPPASDPVTDAP